MADLSALDATWKSERREFQGVVVAYKAAKQALEEDPDSDGKLAICRKATVDLKREIQQGTVAKFTLSDAQLFTLPGDLKSAAEKFYDRHRNLNNQVPVSIFNHNYDHAGFEWTRHTKGLPELLSHEQVLKIFRRHSNQTMMDGWTNVFQKRDVGGNGSLSKQEALNLVCHDYCCFSVEHLQNNWHVYDLEGNGELDVKEFKKMTVDLYNRQQGVQQEADADPIEELQEDFNDEKEELRLANHEFKMLKKKFKKVHPKPEEYKVAQKELKRKLNRFKQANGEHWESKDVGLMALPTSIEEIATEHFNTHKNKKNQVPRSTFSKPKHNKYRPFCQAMPKKLNRNQVFTVFRRWSNSVLLDQISRDFEEWDTDKNGMISLDEALDATADLDWGEDFFAKGWAQFDLDGNGELDFTEFKSMCQQLYNKKEAVHMAEVHRDEEIHEWEIPLQAGGADKATRRFDLKPKSDGSGGFAFYCR